MTSKEEIAKDRLIWMYTQMFRIREFEERVKRTFTDHPGVIRGHAHLGDGAEGAIVGEIYTRRDGLCKGFGGSMHLSDPAHHFPGTSGIIAQSIAHATGAALTAQVKNSGQVVYCFFGDGSTKQGAFFESLNLAAIWKLPVVYVLENNQYQAYTQVGLEDANVMAGDPLSKKAQAFSIPGLTVDGTDVLAVREAVGTAAERA